LPPGEAYRFPILKPLINLNRLNEEQLLDLRLCDLPLRITGTSLAILIDRIYAELAERGIDFRPTFWLAEEWFSPDAVPGIAIPFYLAHPRLAALEKKFMLEVEGGTDQQCMRILRHEAGHALDTAYRLHRRKEWREMFGSFATPYPNIYQPRANSRRFVLHLDAWYAQAHPAEDFAETFAVWLTPNSRWRTRYAGWDALEKLEYVDELMEDIAGHPPVNKKRKAIEPLKTCKTTLREHYRKKTEYYQTDGNTRYDRILLRVFSNHERYQNNEAASVYLRRIQKELVPLVSHGTGVHAYTIRHVVLQLIRRCQELKLRVAGSQRRAWMNSLVMLTTQSMNALHTGHYRFAV
jgi:hypothetical protein